MTLRNEDDPKKKDRPKNADKPKNEDHFKNKVNFKHEAYPKMKRVSVGVNMLSMKTTLRIRTNKKEDNLKNEYSPQNKDEHKNEDNLK